MSRIYVVRHCKAAGQEPEAPLTPEGEQQARRLADFLAGQPIDYLVSSPFRRAQATVAPLAERLGLPVHLDDRLGERVLAAGPLPDWQERLRASFADPDLTLEGGESSRAAMARASAAVDAVLATGAQAPIVVTHGNLMALLLRRFDERFGFESWAALTNPDVFVIEGATVRRIWR
jgi:2,3-bisphosphoglycerate-dependent phosphoglycerate mutase